MELEYTTTDFKGNEKQDTQSIVEYLYDELLYKEIYDRYSREKIRLEDQPKVVCQALGRLVEKLLEKGVFNLEDLKYIADASWGRKSDSLQLKKDES